MSSAMILLPMHIPMRFYMRAPINVEEPGVLTVRDDTVVKIAAIAALVILETINLFTVRWDGQLLFALGAIIGGIAGYHVKRWRRWR